MSDALPPSAKRLERGEFVLLCYRLGQRKATGVLTLQLDQGKSELLVLRQGQVFARNDDALGRQTKRRLETMALAGLYAHFKTGLAAYPPSIGHPLSLAAWARQHLEGQLDSARAQDLVRDLAGVRLVVIPSKLPDEEALDATDLRIVETMRTPRRLDQIWPLARTPRFRLLCFIHFMRSVGAVHEQGVGTAARSAFGSPARQEQAVATLGLRGLPTPQDVKQAYRRLARTLHPDLNHKASLAQRRACEDRLAEVNSAYRELMQAL